MLILCLLPDPLLHYPVHPHLLSINPLGPSSVADPLHPPDYPWLHPYSIPSPTPSPWEPLRHPPDCLWLHSFLINSPIPSPWEPIRHPPDYPWIYTPPIPSPIPSPCGTLHPPHWIPFDYCALYSSLLASWLLALLGLVEPDVAEAYFNTAPSKWKHGRR